MQNEIVIEKLKRENEMLKQMISLLEKRQTMCTECPYKEKPKTIQRFMIVAMLTLICFYSNAQSVNGVNLSDIDSEYVQIVGTSKYMSNKMLVSLDFGQENKAFSASNQLIKDAEGKALVLNSMIDALNFMDGVGYEFVNAYVITVSGQNVYHYILRRKQ